MNAVNALIAVGLLAVINERGVEALTRPLFENSPGLKPYKWALFYLAFVTGVLLGWFSGLNAFAEVLPASLEIGRVLTAAAVGLGSTFLHEVLPPSLTGTEIRVSASEASTVDVQAGVTPPDKPGL